MTATEQLRPGALSIEQMQRIHAPSPGYKASPSAPALAHAALAERLWGGSLTPVMADAQARGRFAGAVLGCPSTACTGVLKMAAGGRSQAWRNPAAVENIFCFDGELELRYGARLEHRLSLGRFDMVSVPAQVRHQIVNTGNGTLQAVLVLSIEPEAGYGAAFGLQAREGAAQAACDALGVSFDDEPGLPVDAPALEARVTRFATLVPYKKDLNRTSGLPPEATEALSAGSVFPLIVPQGHIGRSRTAPIYGHQGLYISIAECRAGDDNPPPHAHSDTQESFFVMDGSFEICTGFDAENVISVKAGDIVAVPPGVMRTFRNTTGVPARLFVIIQGPDRMSDTVSFSRRVGEDFERRFGRETIEAYSKIRMTFDAEERLGA